MKSFIARGLSKAGRLFRAFLEAIPARFVRLGVHARRLALPGEPRSHTLVVVRVDAIGDYVLFRGNLRALKESEAYRGYQITVVGNRLWQALAETLDGDVVDQWIWIDPTRYSRSPWYRAQVLSTLPGDPFDTLVHPTFSRTLWADRLVEDLLARRKIAGTGDRVNKRWSVDRSRQIYTELLPVDHERVLFEVDRNREFFEKLLGVSLSERLPSIPGATLPLEPRVPSQGYVVFHLDASRPEKEWPVENYMAVARHVLDHTNLSVVLLGQGAARNPWTLADAQGRVVDLRDQTTLVQTASVLGRAQGFVGNDSALLHIALAAGVSAVVGICFGQHFGRFVPYPEVAGRRSVFVFPPAIESRMSEAEALKRAYSDGSFENIRDISVDRVIQALQFCLK